MRYNAFHTICIYAKLPLTGTGLQKIDSAIAKMIPKLLTCVTVKVDTIIRQA